MQEMTTEVILPRWTGLKDHNGLRICEGAIIKRIRNGDYFTYRDGWKTEIETMYMGEVKFGQLDHEEYFGWIIVDEEGRKHRLIEAIEDSLPNIRYVKYYNMIVKDVY